MQAPTPNPIHPRGEHLASKSVDHLPGEDLGVYAPEDGRIEYVGQAGIVGTTNDAGLVVQMRGSTGLHQFAHTEQQYVSPGDKVVKGQLIAKMGYTGYTIPSGPGGRHLHYWVKTPENGYVYPPTLYNEPFTKLNDKEKKMITESDIDLLRIGHSDIGGWPAAEVHAGKYDALFMNAWRGRDIRDFLRTQWKNGDKFRALREQQAAAFAELPTRPTKAELESAKSRFSEAQAKIAELANQLDQYNNGDTITITKEGFWKKIKAFFS